MKDGCKRADVYVNPREVSKAVGNKRCNTIKLKQEKNIDVKICTDENLEKSHGQCDHGADGRKVYLYHTVVISKVGRSQLLIVGGTAMF